MSPALDINEVEPESPAGQGFSETDLVMLRATFRSVPGRAVLVDRNLVYRMVNQEYLNFVGKTADEVVGRSVAEVLGEEVAKSYDPFIEHILAGNAFRWEGWADYGRLGRHYVQESISPYQLSENGEVLGAFAIARDLTSVKLHETALEEQTRREAESEALHRAIVSNALDSIIVIDGEGTVIDFNPASERLFGYLAEEAIGREISELIIPEKYRQAHRNGMARYMETGVSRIIGKRLELEAITKSGKTVPVELALSDVSVGKKRLFTAHLRDLTDARAAQFEIERQRDALYQKEKLAALGSLLSGVAHELNNPLAIVIGQAMMLREKIDRGAVATEVGSDMSDRALRIENAANRCARIVKTFLAMARQRKAERDYVQIDAIINDAVELLNYSLRTSDVRLETYVHGELPPTFADADLLHQVLVNLIVNSRQALEEDGGSERIIRIEAHHEPISNRLVILFQDNGPGIPPAIRNRIFDPFFTTKPQDTGTGIGLAVSRGLIEAHNGTLELASPQPEQGACFVITLPVTERDPNSTPALADEALPKFIRSPIARVLIIDDEPELAELMADMVETLGFTTTTATSGHAAQIMLSQSGNFDAILCDIRMPDGDGPGLYDWLSANRPDMTTRIGYVTGDTLGPSAGRFLAKTGCPVIEKPFTPVDIERVLAALLSNVPA